MLASANSLVVYSSLSLRENETRKRLGNVAEIVEGCGKLLEPETQPLLSQTDEMSLNTELG